jgi:malonate-semialdehyde dehydrogenase (acetylating)/methylmalonate-semialdehyde dehydrogenase
VAAGAELVIDGRERTSDDLTFGDESLEGGYFIGPTLFDRVTPDMSIYTDEIFGPVLCIVRAHDYEEALALPSQHEYGNGVAIFTRDGDAARDFCCAGAGRNGRRQRADSGAGRLPHLRRLEAVRFR